MILLYESHLTDLERLLEEIVNLQGRVVSGDDIFHLIGSARTMQINLTRAKRGYTEATDGTR